MKRLVVAFALCAFFAVGAAPAQAVYGLAGKFANTGSGPGGSGSGPGELFGANQIDVNDATGNLYVADTGNDRVQVFKPTATAGEYLDELGLTAPTGLAIDQNGGDVYVSTPTGISKLTVGLTPAGGWTDPGVTGALAVDPSSGDLLVADTGANLIRRYNSDGSADGSFAAERPVDVAANSGGDVFVVTTESDIYNYPCTTGSAVERFSAAGVSEGELSFPAPLDAPSSVAVDLDDDTVITSAFATEYFCERGNLPQVVVFEEDGSFREASPLDQQTIYAAVPGLTAQADGSDRTYAMTRSPFNDDYGETAIFALEDYVAPVVTVDAASEVTPFAATFSGTVNPEGFETICRFQYSDNEFAFDKSAPCFPAPGSGTNPKAVQGRPTGLATDTTYYFRLVATSHNGAVTVTSPVQSFTTAHAELPEVTIAPPTSITATGAALSGTVDPLGNPASYRFEYRLVGEPDWSTVPGGAGSAGSGTGPVQKEAALDVLVPNAPYEVRLTAVNGIGPVSTAPEQFTTEVSAPLVRTLAAGQVAQTSAVLRASINPAGEETTYYFEYGTDTAYGTKVPASGDANAGSGLSTDLRSARIGGLRPGTIYHFRVVAENANGVSEGADSSFMTATTPAGCANEPVRERQGTQFLPECRAYEMISPPQKNGIDVSGYEHSQYKIDFTPMTSVSGDRAAFTSHGSFAGAESNTLFTTYMARRDGQGWTSKPITPYANGAKVSSPMLNFHAFSEDLGRWFLEGAAEPQLTPDAFEGARNAYLWGGTGYRLLTPGMQRGIANYDFGDWSEDQSVVVFELINGSPLVPDAPTTPETRIVYQWDASSGEVTLVAREPGTDAPFQDYVEVATPDTEQTGSPANKAQWNPVSDDGSKVFFYAPETPEQQLYLRVDGTSTRHVSASQRTEPDPNGQQPAVFHFASVDGETAFLSSPEKLTEDATTGPASAGNDLYRYDAGSEELTDITVDSSGANGAEVQGVLGGSDDGRRLYFVAKGELAPGAVAGASNLYLWTDDGSAKGEIEFISAGVDAENWYRLDYVDPRRTGRVTPDGMHVLFMTKARIGGYDNAGHFQAYLYDVAADELVCASCNPAGGAATANAMAVGTGDVVSSARTLSDDGRYVFFGTTESLVATDVNNRLDTYRFDSDGSRVDLLSPGTGEFPAEFQDASADGTSAVFSTRQRLLTSDFDTNIDAYSARVGGGFLGQSPPPPPVPCFGEACRTEPVIPPQPASAASADVNGRGNAKPQKQTQKGKKPSKKCKGKAKRAKKCKAGKGKPSKSKKGSRR